MLSRGVPCQGYGTPDPAVPFGEPRKHQKDTETHSFLVPAR
jgi:hypothetical protein